jgi:hypothetical protein
VKCLVLYAGDSASEQKKLLMELATLEELHAYCDKATSE